MSYPENSGPYAKLGMEEKQKRLDALVQLWQRDSETRVVKEGVREFLQGQGLAEYHYAVALRFPEWVRDVVVAQVVNVPKRNTDMSQLRPHIFTSWQREETLQSLSDWKERLPQETVLNLHVHISPGGLGEGSKWAISMPKAMRERYRIGWSTQADWLAWTQQYDWLALGVRFVHLMRESY